MKQSKYVQRALKSITSPFTLGLAVTCLAVYASHEYYVSRHDPQKAEQAIPKFIQGFHQKTIDWRLHDRGEVKGSDRVAIIAIDEASLEAEGHWPWSRDKMARLVDRAVEAGAKVVGFDMIWAEEDAKSAIPTLTRMKRELASKSQLAPDLGDVFSKELVRANSDQIFANTIANHADRLVLGSFFEDYEPLSPVQEFCTDALFSRTPEGRYWSRESSMLEIKDAALVRMGIPKQLKEHLSDYFTALETSGSAEWFDAHKEMQAKISFALEELSEHVPAEAFPGLATLWLNDDLESTVTVLEQIKPEMANPQGAREFFRRFGSGFSKADQASLHTAIRASGANYCNRVFTDRDELLHEDKYVEMWGGTPESKEQFKALNWAAAWAKTQSSNPDSGKEPLESAIARFKAEALPNSVYNVGRFKTNIPVLAASTKHSGYFNTFQDKDGSIRMSILLARKGNTYAPSLALKMFMLDHGHRGLASIEAEALSRRNQSARVLKSIGTGSSADASRTLQFPTDMHGRLMINYSGSSYMFPHVRASDILSDAPYLNITVREWNAGKKTWEDVPKRVPKGEFMKDKLFIVGATAMGLYDLRVTPFQENYFGVETHANVLSNMLIEQARASGETVDPKAPGFMHVHPAEETFMWLFLLVVGLALSGLLTYFGSIAGLGITAAALSTVYLVDRFFLFSDGVVTTIVFPQLLISLTFVSLTFYKYFGEEKKKRELKGTFAKYVSPAIVDEVLADPSNIELGGKKMELTVMFSDVRGFTTISEKLDPRALSDLLNSYLTPMTNLVFEHKGTLDKYMGDAIMSFWGAPIHFGDHAKHACRCALKMIDKLKELQSEYRAKGLPEIDIGIGLNTGEMSVGNMGSDTVRSYTVMGDAVNLGSRLEGINKQYGTRIIVSEFTERAITPDFVCREVDWVRVKGKAQPVRIFELVCEGKPDDATAKLLALFQEGFKLYHERKFQEAIEVLTKALDVRSDDAVTQLYIERCQDYLREPPPDDWDGVFTMTSK